MEPAASGGSFPSWQLVPDVVGPEVARPGPRLKSESFQLLNMHPLFPYDHLLYVFRPGLESRGGRVLQMREPQESYRLPL